MLVEMDAFLLTLVRHGETSENMQRIMQGHRDTALSERGVRQVRLLAERLQHERFTHVYTSDLQRARQTCQIIMERNTASSVDIIEDKRLRERNVGIMEGRSTSEWRALMKSKTKAAANGVESRQQLHERAVSFFQRVVCRHMRAFLINQRRRAALSAGQASTTAAADHSPSKKRKHIPSSSSFDVFPLEGSGSEAEDDEEDGDDFECLGDRDGTVKVVAAPTAAAAASMAISGPSEDRSSSSSGCSSIATICDWTVDEIPPVSTIPLMALGGLERCDNTSSFNMNAAADRPPVVVRTPLSSTHGVVTSSSVVTTTGGLPPWVCPNVSLLPATDRPLTRVSSVGSGRDICFDDADHDGGGGTFASVLIVTHGGLVTELLTHFVADLGCTVPGGQPAAVDRTSPNTAVSRFSVRLLGLYAGDENEETEYEEGAADNADGNGCEGGFGGQAVRGPVTMLNPTDDDDAGCGGGRRRRRKCGGGHLSLAEEGEDNDCWVPVHISCLMLHDFDHIAHDPDVAPISTRDAI